MRKIFKMIFLIGIFLCSSLLLTGCGDDLVLVTGVDLYINEIHANVNETVDLSYKVYPSNATNKKVTFWSTDENIAEVDAEGKVTIKSRGEASIVVRSVDGGYEDYCKIVTNIDPDQISWDFGDKILKSDIEGCDGETAMALNQVMKLKVLFMQEGKESEIVTNRDVTFSSSNTANIQVINEKEGIIKACNDTITEGDRAYSDITATLKVKNGELKTTCRVYVNKSSSLEKLNVQYVAGGEDVLVERNGSETIYLTAVTSGKEAKPIQFYAFISNVSNEILNDYSIEISNGVEDPYEKHLFTVETEVSTDGIHKFSLIPGEIEGTGTLYIKTTCTDESGKLIRANINVTVQAEIMKVEASATNRNAGVVVDNQREVLVAGEIFSLELTYYDSEIDGKIIEGAQRKLYFDFDALDEEEKTRLFKYISYYGNNQFKVINVPNKLDEDLFSIPCYIYKNENIIDETNNKLSFYYEFHIRNSLESLIVLTEPKPGLESTVTGVSDITITKGGKISLYAYATTYKITNTDATAVSGSIQQQSICTNEYNAEYYPSGKANVFTLTGQEIGDTVMIFTASDGLTTLEYVVNIHVVAKVAEINFYSSVSPEVKFDESVLITDTQIRGDILNLYLNVDELVDNILKLYIKVDALEGHIIENESNIDLKVKIDGIYMDGIIKTEIVEIGEGNNKQKVVCRYIEIDFSSIDSITLSVEAQRVLANTTIKINKAN